MTRRKSTKPAPAPPPVSTVQAWFRTMAIPGVALTPEEAERLCAAAEETP